MYKKVFLDANIIADIYDASRPSYVHSYKALDTLFADENMSLFTSCDIITTLYYILSKRDKKVALDAIMEVNAWCEVIDFANDEIQECCMLMKNNAKYKDLEDTIQYVMAKKMDCDLILSNDKGFMSEEIKVLKSADFLKEIEERSK